MMNDINNQQVPASVMQQTLDKFMSLVEQQNKAYNSMGNAVESVSETVQELTARINSLEKQIADEQLAEVLAESLEEYQAGVSAVRESVAILTESVTKLSLPVVECEDMRWALAGIHFMRKRFILLIFTAGLLISWVSLKAGADIGGVVKLFFQGLIK